MKHFIFSICFLLAVSLFSCGDSKTATQEPQNEESSESISATPPEETQEEEPTEKSTFEGSAVLKVGDNTFEGLQFLLDPSTPKSEWLTNSMVGMENEKAVFAAAITATAPSQFSLVLGYSGEKVNEKSLSGTFSLDPNSENPFTISAIMDNNMKNFTFSAGSVEIVKLTPETVELKAKGTGLYANIEKQEYLENQPATFNIKLSFPNIIVNGKDVKRVTQ